MKKENLIILVFVFLFFLNCNPRDNYKSIFIQKPEQKEHNAIVLSDLEVHNDTGFDLPDADSPDWKPVKIPFIHRMQSAPLFMNFNSVWLRGKFKLNGHEWNPRSDCYGIRLGPVSAVNIVYMNGLTVGSLYLDELNKLLWPCSYVFPTYVNLKETNEVYIRFITGNEYITLISDIIIQDEESFSRSEKWNNFLYNQFPMGICILFIGVVALFLYNYFIQKNKRYFFYSIGFANTIIILLLIYFPSNTPPIELKACIISALLLFNILFTFIIFQSFYGIYLWKHNITAAVILLLLSVFIFKRSHNSFNTDVFLRPLAYAEIVSLFYIIFLICLLNLLKQDRYKLYFSITLFIIIFIAEVVQSAGIFFNIWYHYFYILYSTPLFAIFIIIFEIRENKQRRIELKKLHEKLKKNGIDNNSITESAEKKIEKIIGFLNENFTSDISREGLASAVDMNPNYMSTIFYRHKGKKINDYINGLRIGYAARQLTGPDNGKKIIDIALGVGFDSLTTFNRLFKSIHKITPTEFKKKNNNKPQ